MLRKMPHREVVWVILDQFSNRLLLLLLLSLWACGQRACVVHHVHSDARTSCAHRLIAEAAALRDPPSGVTDEGPRCPRRRYSAGSMQVRILSRR